MNTVKIIHNLKQLMVIMLFVVAVPLISSAQQKSLTPEEIASMKVAYITNRLELTSGEAEKLWPIYNEYQAKKATIRKAEKGLKLEQSLLDLKVKYHSKFAEVVPTTKVELLYTAEKEFKVALLEALSGGSGNN